MTAKLNDDFRHKINYCSFTPKMLSIRDCTASLQYK